MINVPAVQNFVVQRVTDKLSAELHTRVSIRHVNFRLFNKFTIDGAYIEDQQKDTLLYANHLTLNVTDFFFLKNKAVFSYVGLDSATIHLDRPAKDSTWNYQFLIDAFSSNDTTSGGQPPAIDLRKVRLTNIRFNKTDGWNGQDMLVSAGSISIDARQLDLKKRRLLINDISLKQPSFVLVNYKAGHPPDTSATASQPDEQPDSTRGLQWNPAGWDLQVGKLSITKGAFGLVHKDQPHIERYFDPAHIAVYDIGAHMDSIRWIKDSIMAKVDLNARERSGFEIEKLKSRFKLSPVEMEFAQLDLRTNQSHLQGYYSMQFSDFSDMSDYISRVFMQADLHDSHVASDDIAYFAPALSDWKKDITISGNAYGTVDNLTGNNLQIQAGSNTRLHGQLKMRGLPNINETFIDFRADELVTTGQDMQRFLPGLRQTGQIDLTQLSRIQFKGNFVGFIYDFVAYGDFNTNLGAFHSDLNMKWGSNHQVPSYSGNISTDHFNFGQLLLQPNIGNATLHATINGQGFNFNDLDATINGTIQQVDLYGYTYQNIETKGTLEKKLFNGSLSLDDPNAAFNFAGSIDFNDSLPVFNFQSEIFRSDLRALGLTKDSITFSGLLDLNFTGSNIDNFLGDARLHNIALFKNNTRVEIDSVALHSAVQDRQKLIRLQSNEVDAYIKGNYNVQHLSAAVKLLFNHYYPSLIPRPEGVLPDEDFSFEITLGKVQKILEAFTSRVTGLDDSHLRGSINTTADSLSLEASIPAFGYDRFRLRDINISGTGKGERLGLTTTFQGLFVRDSLLVPSATIKATSHADTSFLNFKTTGDSTLNNADLYTRVIMLPSGGYNFKILNSELVINNKDWHITSDNEITLQKDAITVYNFNISHNEQRVTLTSSKADSSLPSFVVNLQNINLSDFSQFISKSTPMEGITNGTIRIDDPLKNLFITGSIETSQFRLNDDSIGTVRANASYDKVQGILKWDLQKNDNPQRNFSVSGSAGLTEQNKQLSGNIVLDHTNIGWLQGFIQGYASHFKGMATGKLSLGGSTDAPTLNGAIKLDSVGLRVDYLGTYYTLGNETINFSDNAVDVGTMALHDVNGQTAVLSGKLTHDHFQNIRFNFDLTALNFQLLNTSAADNPLYYGTVYANGRLSFTGPLNDMQMAVTLSPTQNTHLYLPLTDSKDIGKHDFIIFKQYGKELKPEKIKKEKTNLTVKLNAIMNPQARVDVILDPTTGDMISATGNGALQIGVSLNGDFKMYGNYGIEEGYYNFSFRNLLNRKFQINNGSTISWNGDAADAKVDITAIYSVPGGATLYDLVAGEAETSGGINPDSKDIRQREKVDVYLNLKGSLRKPDITYDIQLPDAGISTGSYAMTKLQQIKQDPNELLTQVTGLLVLGQFIPPASSTASSSVLRSSGLSNAGQWVSSQLTGVLTNILGNRLKAWGIDFNVNYNAYSASGDQGDPLQRNDVQLNLGTSLFNNRVRLEVGPSIDWGRANSLSSQAISNSYFAGDFRVEYLITPDGHIRFFGFSRSNYDVLLDRNLTRSGLGIAYRRDFDVLHEIFEDKKQQRRLDSLRRARLQDLERQETEDQLPAADSSTKSPSDSLLLPSPADTTYKKKQETE